MKPLTVKDFAKYRGAVTARAKMLLAEARGTRWDRFAGRVAGSLGFVAGLSGWVGFVPAKYAAPAAGTCAVCAALAPRALRAAGILEAAYGQKRPLWPVLRDIAQVFANPGAIIAEAKTEAQQAEAEQAQQQAAALAQQQSDAAQQHADRVQQAQATQQALMQDAVEAAVIKVVSRLSGAFVAGQQSGNLSQAVPPMLKEQPVPASVPAVPEAENEPENDTVEGAKNE